MHRRQHAPVRAVIVLALTSTALIGCGGANDTEAERAGATDQVLTTTATLADITAAVGCGRLDVRSIIPAGTDAHQYEASVQDADRLEGAAVVVANGLGLEEGLADAIDRAGSSGATVVEVGPEVSPISNAGADSGTTGTGGVDPDPHVWMDPARMAVAAEVVADTLAEVQGLPVDPEEIRACGDAYRDELLALDEEMEGILATIPDEHRRLVTDHEALAYLADRFDLEVMGTVIPSTSTLGETNPRDLEELAAAVRRSGVRAVFRGAGQPAGSTEQLADLVGGTVDVVELYVESPGATGSGAETYVSMMRTNAHRIADALGAGPDDG